MNQMAHRGVWSLTAGSGNRGSFVQFSFYKRPSSGSSWTDSKQAPGTVTVAEEVPHSLGLGLGEGEGTGSEVGWTGLDD